ncbi:hypothetical protein AB0C07_34795 [Actinoplanes missouriensis]|uniref:hypothetical protein n=1 Tax=Actinoplanes missouriensis TaxID=1866 RepID=UPI0033F870FA
MDAVTGEQLLAREDGVPSGCGLWTRLESGAARAGCATVRLGTHCALTEAIALYRRSGYREIPNYSDSPYNQLAFEKKTTLKQ